MKKNLLITSIGDNTKSFYSWYSNRMDRNFDIIFIYYGNNINTPLINYCDTFIESKGSKINNIKSNFHLINFNLYDYIFMIDDDINLTYKQINKLFQVSKKMNINIATPSHSPLGKISHKVMETNDISFIRSTNFVEITCPIFSKECFIYLFRYLKHKDILYEYGIDYVMSFLFFRTSEPFYIFDFIEVMNPIDLIKPNKTREADILNTEKERYLIWKKFKKKYNIKQCNHVVLQNIC